MKFMDSPPKKPYLCFTFNQNLNPEMKKVFLFATLGGALALASCGGGPSDEEKAAAEQARLDSIKAAEQAKLDAMAAEAAAREAAAYAAGQASAEAEAATEEAAAPAKEEPKQPANIIEGKKQAAEEAGKTNIIEAKKGAAEQQKASGENMIEAKKKKANQ